MFFLLQIVKFEVENFGIFSSWGQTSEFWQKRSHDREGCGKNTFWIVSPHLWQPPFFRYLRLFKNLKNCGALNKAIKRPASLGGHIFPHLSLTEKKAFFNPETQHSAGLSIFSVNLFPFQCDSKCIFCLAFSCQFSWATSGRLVEGLAIWSKWRRSAMSGRLAINSITILRCSLKKMTCSVSLDSINDLQGSDRK